MQKIIILINRISENPTPDEIDVIDQAAVVEKALIGLGYECEREFIDLNLNLFYEKYKNNKPELIFNLVESLNNNGGIIHFIPSLLEVMKIPFTGCPADGMFLTTNKVLTKKILFANNLATPEWHSAPVKTKLSSEKRYIAKSCNEDASIGISDKNVFYSNNPEILEHFSQIWGDNYFIEEYIEGREFNISVLGGKTGAQVLFPAEIIFNNYTGEKPKIISYEAKWDESSFEYHNTVRTFEFKDSDKPLIKNLEEICLKCWHVFNLKGYVRVDFRVDKNNRPYILEINPNPCISPDAGFYAACKKTGLEFTQVIERIIEDAVL
ncbi:MAG: ATP-grasp domain-containing protein [Bacteroidota bacterium]